MIIQNTKWITKRLLWQRKQRLENNQVRGKNSLS